MAGAILALSGIYAIRNKVSGKVYIGRAINLEKRKRRHFAMLRLGNHHSEKLQRAWNKSGPDAFVAETLIRCHRDHLELFEQICIDGYDSYRDGYNACPISGAPMAGKTNTPESNELRSVALTGIKRSAEHGANTSFAMNGVKHPPERVAANAAARRRPEARAATSARMMGNKNGLGTRHTEQSKTKMSASWTPERKAALSARMKANNPRSKAT